MGFCLYVFVLFCSGIYSQNNILTLDSAGDKQFHFEKLKQIFQDKRVICLGETEHRIETFLRFKVQLVKYLHAEMGFEVIGFESSLFNTSNAYYNYSSDTLALQEAVYGIWQTQSVLNLFSYIHSEKKAASPLVLTGFDVKSGTSYATSNWLKRICKPINSSWSDLVYKTDTALMNANRIWESSARLNKMIPLTKGKSTEYIRFYNAVSDSLKSNQGKLLKQGILTEEQFKIICQSVINRKYLAEFLCIADIPSSVSYRDNKMAENITWLVDELYKDKKIILWAADDHISKKCSVHYPHDNYKCSVEVLPKNVKDQLFSISLNFFQNSPRKEQKEMKAKGGTIFFIDHPTFLMDEFDGVFYFTNSESTANYSIKK